MKRIFTMLALAAFSLPLLAQSPDLMTYQAVVRDAENHLLTNQAVAVQISIIQTIPDGTPVYIEVHTLITNANGLVSLEIGDGVTGDDFSTIDWSSGPYFIKTETDPTGGSNYTITSTSQLLSVPYAQYADEAGNVFSGAFGDLSGAPTNVSDFTNDAGYLDSQLWSQNGSNLYYQDGDVGIGTSSPTTTLDVVGDTKFGSNGVAFIELREITGTTHATNSYISLGLPSGYTETNTRILSLEINYNGDRWTGLGFDNTTDHSIAYLMNGFYLYIYYPASSLFYSKAFRVLIMRVTP